MYKVLIVGGSGLIGKAIISEIVRYKEFDIYRTYYKNPAIGHKYRNFNLVIDPSSNISNILSDLKPQIVISCLRGDYNKQLVLHTKIAEYLESIDGKLYFFSSANVFDNDLSTPHYESDLPNSCTDYGQYKLECEKRITEILHDNACILRLPQIWGKDSPRMNLLVDYLSNNKSIEVYPKLFYTTNTDLMVARQLIYIIQRGLNGIFHLTTEDIISQKDFYKKLVTGLGYNNPKLQDKFQEEGYFVLLSNRTNEFPDSLRLTNYSVVDYLSNSIKSNME